MEKNGWYGLLFSSPFSREMSSWTEEGWLKLSAAVAAASAISWAAIAG
jgi:hypothetical protein